MDAGIVNLPTVQATVIDYEHPNFVIDSNGELALAEYDRIPIDVASEPVAGPSGTQTCLPSSISVIESDSDSDDGDVSYPTGHFAPNVNLGDALEGVFGSSTHNPNYGYACSPFVGVSNATEQVIPVSESANILSTSDRSVPGNEVPIISVPIVSAGPEANVCYDCDPPKKCRKKCEYDAHRAAYHLGTPFACTYCGAKFLHKPSLVRHIKRRCTKLRNTP